VLVAERRKPVALQAGDILVLQQHLTFVGFVKRSLKCAER
jgi:hypothetical protein